MRRGTPTFADTLKALFGIDEADVPRHRAALRARAADPQYAASPGFEYSSGFARRTLGAPNLSQLALDRFEARLRVAAKRHRRIVERGEAGR